jgi:tetratricopeptide (TPR) repeat protein
MSAIAAILRNRDQYGLSIEYLRTILKLDSANGDVWGQLGMLSPHIGRTSSLANSLQNRPLLFDDGQSSGSIFSISTSTLSPYRSKGQLLDRVVARASLTSVQEPKLWYGIGILYDRYGSLEHAEEAFSQVMRMSPEFDKANEVYFRLGIIYKQQSKYTESLSVRHTFRLHQDHELISSSASNISFTIHLDH